MLGARINLSLLLIIGSSYSFASTLIPNKDGVPSGKKLTDGSNTIELPKSPVQMLERSEPFSNPRLERDAAECQEGAEWTDDCNRCRCQNGLPTCTSRICLHDQECVEGSSWTFGCNTCYCFNGKPACTSMLCLHEQASECVGGTHWMDNCNPCYCKFGRSFCTQDDCVDELPKQDLHICEDGFKQCVTGQCLPMDHWCDRDPDCPDASDEKICYGPPIQELEPPDDFVVGGADYRPECPLGSDGRRIEYSEKCKRCKDCPRCSKFSWTACKCIKRLPRFCKP